MKIKLGTKYITKVPKNGRVPCDCSKGCDVDFLWYAGWRVRLGGFLGISYLVWSQDGKKVEKDGED